MKSRLNFVLSLCCMTILFGSTGWANGSGYVGRTTIGCTCHSDNSSPQTRVFFRGSPTELRVKLGDTLDLRAVVAHQSSSMRAAGFNAAVRTSESGGSIAGQMISLNGAGTRVINNEITQSTPKTLTNQEAEFQFQWKAPQQPGTFYLHVVGNAVNRNGSDAGDMWNKGVVIPVIVESAMSIATSSMSQSAISVNPNPATDFTVIHGVDAGVLSAEVRNVQGERVRTLLPFSTDNTHLPWDTRNDEGQPVAHGVYFVIVVDRTGLRRIPVVVAR